MRTFRPRISILTSLLLMTILGMGLVIGHYFREVAAMRVQLRALRDETGQITPDDPTKLYAIEIRTPDEYDWKWRFWLPEGHKYLLNMARSDIPRKGFPKGATQIVMDHPGETWVEFRITKGADDAWKDVTSLPSGEMRRPSSDWVSWLKKINDVDGNVGYKTVMKNPDQRLVLIRYRVSQTATRIPKIEDPSAGFMIWLEETK